MDSKLIGARIISWIKHLEKVENLAPITIGPYKSAIVKFYEMNDVALNKEKIKSYLPRNRKINDDRAYTREEIATLLLHCGPRERALVLLLASTGMRIEGAAELQIKHISKIDQYSLYRVIVYQGESEEYFCFTTPEAAQAVDSYIQYRERYGEKISPEAPLIREEFDINDQFIARHPREMSGSALGDIIGYKLQRAGITQRTPMKEGQRTGQKRNPIARTHGFRKFVITNMVRCHVDAEVRKKLVGQSIDIDEHYYRPHEDEFLHEYLKAVDALTINEANRLKRENEMLKVRKSEYEQLKEELYQTDAWVEYGKQQYYELREELSRLQHQNK